MHLQHLLYVKDQSIGLLDNKLRSFKEELSKIVSTKVYAKSNQTIFSMDRMQRQLRMIKDNMSLFELQLNEKIKHKYETELRRLNLELTESQAKFGEYQKGISATVNADVRDNLNTIDQKIRQKAQIYKQTDDELKVGMLN